LQKKKCIKAEIWFNYRKKLYSDWKSTKKL